MDKEEKTILKRILELITTLIIGALVIIIVSCAVKRGAITNDDNSVNDDYDTNYSKEKVNENFIKLLEYNLAGDSMTGAEVSQIISLSYDESTYEIEITGYVCQEENDDKLIQTKVKYTNQNKLEDIIYNLGLNDIIPSQYSCTNEYLTIGDKNAFLENSNFKNDYTTSCDKGVVGVTSGINPEYYYFQTYRQTILEVISINGLKFDNTNYTYSKTNIKKTDSLKEENPYTYNFLFFIS